MRLAAAAWLLCLGVQAHAAELDGLGRPVSPAAVTQLSSLEGSVPRRRLNDAERKLVLTLLNSPELDRGAFKDRVSLVRYFLEQGVALSAEPGSDVTDTDIWRLVRAARAASSAFKIPPAILLCLTFRESGFNPRASAWTTTAKGLGQMTNPAVTEAVERITLDGRLRNETEAFAVALGIPMPNGVQGAPDVDAITRELKTMDANGAPAAQIDAKRKERRAAIARHKDEPGHIYNLETNFGLSSAYLAYLRRTRLAEIVDEQKGWYTAVGSYNQGIGVANEYIYKVYGGAKDYNAQPLDKIFSTESLGRLSISPSRRQELVGEVMSVYRCAGR
ncbi:MAG: hypothetical protein HY925_10740 [Elusimicrobia bacterium]|nr:hypothetical protein [Elusimicrobiota bacterium]